MSDLHESQPCVRSLMASNDSADSFDFVGVLDPDESQFLTASISMGSLWSIESWDDSFKPPFPNDRPEVPMAPILFDGRCMLFPRGASNTKTDDFDILTSILTVPRADKMNLRPICIDLWLKEFDMSAAPPGNSAWESATSIPVRPSILSDSMFTPRKLRDAMKYAKTPSPMPYPIVSPLTFGSIEQKPSRRPSVGHQARHRKALVFEREITLNMEGKSKRWSLQVPASTMNPEMVDMMLELQDLNSFFKDSLEDLDESVAALGMEKDKLDPPSLMVSDSHHSISLSPESPTPAPRRPPMPLAARRGKNLRPLSLKEKAAPAVDPYSSIPTAFLGSPSAYSPKFEFTNSQRGPPLDIGEMISSLRSQLSPYSQIQNSADLEPVVDSSILAISFAPPSDQEITDDDDDWAFAVSFLNEFGGDLLEFDGSQKASRSNLECRPHPSVGESSCAKKGGDFLSPSVQNTILPPPSPMPSSPIPATPVQQASLSTSPSPGGVRGILKSCKNVRFATLPEKSEVVTVVTPPSPCAPAKDVSAVVAPSRIAYSHTQTSKTSSENTPIIVAPRSYRPVSSYIPAGTKGDKAGTPRLASGSPSIPVDPLQSKKLASSSRNLSPPRPAVRHSAAPVMKVTTMSLGRQSFGRALKGAATSKNEIKDSAPSSQGGADQAKDGASPTRNKAGSRWTMNDMTFRRGSAAGTPDGTPKSRMPVPLRNILTRFK
ncbi:hypothetical protein DXG03_009403 [Asterophora parasitica]|uniref:Uncharacterized protein n=1 Tax=Asterophora parasitica TaxID=117018 RepID=A0A9P7GI69_9AGAR|nr:hypothetical protein DXG03_009403 [Asterophora parasitica]